MQWGGVLAAVTGSLRSDWTTLSLETVASLSVLCLLARPVRETEPVEATGVAFQKSSPSSALTSGSSWHVLCMAYELLLCRENDQGFPLVVSCIVDLARVLYFRLETAEAVIGQRYPLRHCLDLPIHHHLGPDARKHDPRRPDRHE